MANLVTSIDAFKLDYAQRLIDNNIPADIPASAKTQLELGFMDMAEQMGESLQILLTNVQTTVAPGIAVNLTSGLTISIGTGKIL